MSAPTIRFPVTCPRCGNDVLMVFPVLVIASALSALTNIRLHASCHDQWWDASKTELEQIREYLDALWVDAQSP
jgi:hypothetical protein